MSLPQGHLEIKPCTACGVLVIHEVVENQRWRILPHYARTGDICRSGATVVEIQDKRREG